MAGEIQLNSVTLATESSGTITVSNVDSATNRQNLGLEIGVDVQQFDADTTKNDVANTFTANQIISVTDNTNAALRVTQLGTGNALVVEDETNPDSTPFVVDSSGNVGIGTNPNSLLHLSSAGSTILNVEATGANDSRVRITAGNANISYLEFADPDDNDTGEIRYDHSTNSMQFRTNGNTERMSIGSSGSVTITSNASQICDFVNSNNVSGDSGLITRLGSNCNNTSSYLFIGETGGANKIFIYGNGNVVNTGNSYGQLSDIKLKENITEATPKLNDLMQVRIVNFNLKAEPDLKQIGVIAQELEEIFPNLIDEHPDHDTEGNALGTTTKSVKMSVFVPILIKAMQEQQAIIESQQSQIDALTARIEALETN